MSLTYNRTLFKQAGLDPDKPPTTWDEVRAAAKTIAEKTGVAGFAQMATENTGGWQLTTSTYALRRPDADGRRRRQGHGDLNNPATKAALERLKAMRWAGQVDGLQLRLRLGLASTRPSPPARSACSRAAPTSTPPWSRTTASSPTTTASAAIPLAEGRTPASSAAARSPPSTSSPATSERDAAVEWIDFYYMQQAADQGWRRRRRQGAPGQQPAGRRAGPADLRQGDLRRNPRAGSRTTSTSRPAQMTPFTSKIFDQPLVTEPTPHTQELYAALDPVVQAVLTDQNAEHRRAARRRRTPRSRPSSTRAEPSSGPRRGPRLPPGPSIRPSNSTPSMHQPTEHELHHARRRPDHRTR